MYNIQLEVETEDYDEREHIESLVGVDVSFAGGPSSVGFEFSTIAEAVQAYDKVAAYQLEEGEEIEAELCILFYDDDLPLEEMEAVDTYFYKDGEWHIDVGNKLGTPITIEQLKVATELE